MRELIKITKALADPNRIRILLALHRKELCVCQIVELLPLAPSTISKHLSILDHASLIVPRKVERWIYYRLPDKEATATVRNAIQWIHQSLAKSPEVAADAKALRKILNLDPSALCQRQNQR